MKPSTTRAITSLVASLAGTALTAITPTAVADRERARALMARERAYVRQAKREAGARRRARLARTFTAAGASTAAAGAAVIAAGASTPGAIIAVVGAVTAVVTIPGWRVKGTPGVIPVPVPAPVLPASDPLSATAAAAAHMERVLWAQTETARAWPDITAPVLRSLPYAADRCHTLILTARAVPPASRPQNLVEGLCGVVVDYQRLSRAVAETVTMAAAASVVVPPGREYGDGVMTVDEAIAELEGVRAWYASYAGGVI